jgi:hypothetical protein
VSSWRNLAKGPGDYRRGRPEFPPSGNAFLIVTEGKKTEPNYLEALRKRLELSAAEVVIEHPDGTDPEFTTSPFADCDSVARRLKKKYWPGYSKGAKPSAEFLKKLPFAVLNAQRCRNHHKACRGSGNPSTKVDKLVKSLNSATRRDLQFPLA